MSLRRMKLRSMMALVFAAAIATRALTVGWEVSGEIRRHDHVFAVMCENGVPGLGFHSLPDAPFLPSFGRRILGPFGEWPRPCLRPGKFLAESCSLDHPEIYRFGGISWTEEVVESCKRAQAECDGRK